MSAHPVAARYDDGRHLASVFFKDSKGTVFHTYSAYARGIDLVNTAYNYLDLLPKDLLHNRERTRGGGGRDCP